MKNRALGMVETYGYVGAIVAADVCVKAANVELLGCEFVKGGLVTIHIRGDVGAVKASIDAAVAKVGSILSTHVIPRPSDDVEKMLPCSKSKVQDQEEKEESEGAVDDNETMAIASPKTIEELNKLKTVELRGLARELDDKKAGLLSIERNQIKYSKKNELIEAILKFYEGAE